MNNFEFPQQQPQRVVFGNLNHLPVDEPDNEQGDGRIHQVMSGQKLVILAIALKIACFMFMVGVTSVPGVPIAVVKLVAVGAQVAILAGLVLSLVGILRLAAGLGYGIVCRVAFCCLMFVPLASLIVLVSLNSSATKLLRAHGYTIGIMGARPRYE